MRELPRDLVTILRTEAKNCRNPPVDYVIAEDGGRMVHHPEPDIAMAELLEEAATALAAKDAELAAVKSKCQALDNECQQSMLDISRERDRAERAEAELARRDMQLGSSAKVALDLSAQLAEARKALDEAIKTAGEQAILRGEAEGKLAASEMAGIVDGWKRRAEAAEARLAEALKALGMMLKEHDILSGNFGDVMDPKHKRPDRWPTAAEAARRVLEGGKSDE